MGLGVVCIVRTVDRAPTFVAVSCVLASLWSELTEFKLVISVVLCIFWSYNLDSSVGVQGLAFPQGAVGQQAIRDRTVAHGCGRDRTFNE